MIGTHFLDSGTKPLLLTYRQKLFGNRPVELPVRERYLCRITCHHAMQMGMKQNSLPPGMQDGRKTDLRPEPLRVGGQFEQRLGGPPEQERIKDPLILENQWFQLFRQCEYHVEVFNG